MLNFNGLALSGADAPAHLKGELSYCLRYVGGCIGRGAELGGFQHLDACGLKRVAEGGGIAGLLGLVLDADGDNAVERRALHADGSTIGGHPGLEIGKILFQVRVGRDERVALIACLLYTSDAADE